MNDPQLKVDAPRSQAPLGNASPGSSASRARSRASRRAFPSGAWERGNKEPGRAGPVLALCVLSLLTLTNSLCAADAPQFSAPGLFENIGVDQKPGAAVPLDLRFRDEANAEVRLGDFFDDRPVLLNLVYFECPMLCNMTMDGLIRTLRTLPLEPGRDFTILTVSFDHREDAKLAAGARRTALQRYGKPSAAQGWHFLTGDEASIRQLTDAVGFRFAYNAKLDQYAHPATLIVLTPDGRVSRYFNGIEYAARDLRLGLVEASERKIGTVTDQIQLLCYQYDPTTSTYGLRIQYALQVLGMGTLAVLVGAVTVMLRRERRQRMFDEKRANPV